jgi:probable HAF family extracellular repeat protein
VARQARDLAASCAANDLRTPANPLYPSSGHADTAGACRGCVRFRVAASMAAVRESGMKNLKHGVTAASASLWRRRIDVHGRPHGPHQVGPVSVRLAARLRPLAAAVGLALASLLAPAGAATVVAHWTVTDLGTLGGSQSFGYAINADGQVTGYSTTTAGATHAFLYSNGSMTDLNTLGGPRSKGVDINAAGQVTGFSNTTSGPTGPTHAFVYSNGVMTDLKRIGISNAPERPDDRAATYQGGISAAARSWQRCPFGPARHSPRGSSGLDPRPRSQG